MFLNSTQNFEEFILNITSGNAKLDGLKIVMLIIVIKINILS